MHNSRFNRLAALGGLIGPALFGLVLLTLTLAQYDFMLSLGWNPISAPTFDWPSGLALGPYGLIMTLTFILNGALMSFFAFGLRARLAAGHAGNIGTFLFALAGLALMGLSFTTDPTLRTTPATLHGRLHDLSFVVLGVTFPSAMLILALAFRRDPHWMNLSTYTFITVALAFPAFWLKGAAFYVFLAAILVWSEVIAWRLNGLT